MNTIKTAAVTLLIATLSVAQASFAHERGGDNDDYGRTRYSRYDGRGDWDRCDVRERHRHAHPGRGYGYGYGRYERSAWAYPPAPVAPRVVAPQIVLPLPLPPVPVIVLKKHHDARVVLRPVY